MFVRATAGGFHWTAMAASTSLMVSNQHLARVQGFNQMLQGGLSILGAPLGALLLAVLPMQGVLAIDIGTALLAILPLLFVSIPQPARTLLPSEGSEKPSVWEDFHTGLRYLRGWPGAVGRLVMATLINLLLTPTFALLPLLVTKHFGGQALQLATLESTAGVGIVLGMWGGFRRRILTSMAGLVLIGLGSVGLGLAPSSAFPFAVAAMFVLGISNPVTNGPLFAIIQAVVEPNLQGRVLSLIGSASAAAAPLGLVIAGPVADSLGVRAWFLMGGFLTLVMAITALFIPAMMRMEEGPPTLGRSPTPLPEGTVRIANPGD